MQSGSSNVINNIEINLCSLAVIFIIEIQILFYLLLFFDNVLYGYCRANHAQTELSLFYCKNFIKVYKICVFKTDLTVT